MLPTTLTHISANPSHPKDAVRASLYAPDVTHPKYLPPTRNEGGELCGRRCIAFALFHLSRLCTIATFCIVLSRMILCALSIAAPTVPLAAHSYRIISFTAQGALSTYTAQPLLLLTIILIDFAVALFMHVYLSKNQIRYIDYLDNIFFNHLERRELFAAEQTFHAREQYPCDMNFAGMESHGMLISAYVERNRQNPNLSELRRVLDRMTERLTVSIQLDVCASKLLSDIASLFENFDGPKVLPEYKKELLEALSPERLKVNMPIAVCDLILRYLPSTAASHIRYLVNLHRDNDELDVAYLPDGHPLIEPIKEQRQLQSQPNHPQVQQEPSYLLRAISIIMPKEASENSAEG